MTISWGPTTVFGGSSNPAPAGGGLFSSSTPAPAPASSGGMFGSTPAPSSGGFFGSSTASPAPAFGSFGTATTSSMFGSSGTSGFGAAPSSSLFGSPAPASAFGSTSAFGMSQQQQQLPQQPQIPAQAAMHAHMEAMNRAETEKIKAELSRLYSIYTGSAPDSKKNNNFVAIVYNDLTQDQRHMQWLHGTAAGGQPMPIPPPKPPQVSEEEWNEAVVQNPDPLNYMPIALVGADALSARVSWQQERAKQLAQAAESIKASNETAAQLFGQARKRLEDIKRSHANHRKRLLNVMRKVEVVRCMNQSLQPDEVRAMHQLQALDQRVRDARQLLAKLESQSRMARPDQFRRGAVVKDIELPDREKLAKVLNEHREDLKKLTLAISEDARDVELIKERVVPRLTAPPTR